MANEVMNVVPQEMEITRPGFESEKGFALLQRMAKMFSMSSIVPETFRGENNFGNCVIAVNMAQRMGADPLMVMQNMYIVYGNPAWSSKFMIATFNTCGRYDAIKYKEIGKRGDDSQGIIAWTREKATGDIIEGPAVTIGIAKAEGWYTKSGSKWKTMPDQMLRYRAASWLIRTTAPEISMGLMSVDEAEDAGTQQGTVIDLDDAMVRAEADTMALPEAQPVVEGIGMEMPEAMAKPVAQPAKASVKAETKASGKADAPAAELEEPGF